MKLRALGDWFGALQIVGVRSAFWLAIYRLECATGLVRLRTPVRRWEDVVNAHRSGVLENSSALNSPPFFFHDVLPQMLISPMNATEAKQKLISELSDIERGVFPFWGATRDVSAFPPEWNRNPLTGRVQPADRHWSLTPEVATGDVKGLWELSRFTAAFRLARIHAFCGEERAAEAFWRLVESWMADNPPNAGAQWLSAQEVALRLMAWEFGRNAFARSPSSTPERTRRLAAAIGEHARRIEATISYARAQNNNHLIAEAAGLLTAGWMHPHLPGAARWVRAGRGLMEESAGQFFADGGYIQHSHNYHRFALQLCAWSMRLAEIHGKPFPDRMYAKMRASLAFLRTMLDPQTGRVPNFGHNDGTLFLPLSDCGYADYRPLVQMLSLWLEQKPVFPSGDWDEESLWLLGVMPPSLTRQTSGGATRNFPQAGLYQLGGKESRVILRTARFASRPAHSDQLHADIWWRGENIASDAGSYLYSGDPPWQNPFADAATHNTVTVDGMDPMRRSGRFLWTRLAQAELVRSGEDFLEVQQNGYRRLGLIHRRVVIRTAPDVWRVEDFLDGSGVHEARLHWLLPDAPWEWVDVARNELGPDADWRSLAIHLPVGTLTLSLGTSALARWSIVRAGEIVFGEADSTDEMPLAVRGWRSERYGEKMPALSIAVETNSKLPLRFVSIWVCGQSE
jgi:hypothetical protein